MSNLPDFLQNSPALRGISILGITEKEPEQIIKRHAETKGQSITPPINLDFGEKVAKRTRKKVARG